MPEVTGNLADVGLGHLEGLQPEIIFTLNGPNTNLAGGVVYATRDEVVPVAAAGGFTATLAATTGMRARAWYTMRVRWLEPGAAGGFGYTAVDLHGVEVNVPAAGGLIGDLIGSLPTNLRAVYVSLTEPSFALPFMLWLEQDPDDQANPANTGNLYEWSNF